jgi:hypothetical protein
MTIGPPLELMENLPVMGALPVNAMTAFARKDLAKTRVHPIGSGNCFRSRNQRDSAIANKASTHGLKSPIDQVMMVELFYPRLHFVGGQKQATAAQVATLTQSSISSEKIKIVAKDKFNNGLVGSSRWRGVGLITGSSYPTS